MSSGFRSTPRQSGFNLLLARCLVWVISAAAYAQMTAANPSTSPAADAATRFAQGSIWILTPTKTEIRWLEIHDVERMSSGALYHVSILARINGDPIWKVQHLFAHLAITEAALERSVLQPTARILASYPETYDDAYRKWLALRSKGSAPICDTSVIECAHL